MKVVIDTNVFVASFFGKRSRDIVDLWMKGQILLCLSRPILDEYVSVLTQRWLRGRGELDEILDMFDKRANVLFTDNPKRVKVVKDDPSDDKFLGCAASLEADYLVTSDRALLEIERYGVTGILTASDFLESRKI
jgi:putative PIN family toxin of toxin-antitoxin system